MSDIREFKPGDLYIHKAADFYDFVNHIWQRRGDGTWTDMNGSGNVVYDGDIEWVLHNNDKAIWISEGVVQQP